MNPERKPAENPKPPKKRKLGAEEVEAIEREIIDGATSTHDAAQGVMRQLGEEDLGTIEVDLDALADEEYVGDIDDDTSEIEDIMREIEAEVAASNESPQQSGVDTEELYLDDATAEVDSLDTALGSIDNLGPLPEIQEEYDIIREIGRARVHLATRPGNGFKTHPFADKRYKMPQNQDAAGIVTDPENPDKLACFVADGVSQACDNNGWIAAQLIKYWFEKYGEQYCFSGGTNTLLKHINRALIVLQQVTSFDDLCELRAGGYAILASRSKRSFPLGIDPDVLILLEDIPEDLFRYMEQEFVFWKRGEIDPDSYAAKMIFNDLPAEEDKKRERPLCHLWATFAFSRINQEAETARTYCKGDCFSASFDATGDLQAIESQDISWSSDDSGASWPVVTDTAINLKSDGRSYVDNALGMRIECDVIPSQLRFEGQNNEMIILIGSDGISDVVTPELMAKLGSAQKILDYIEIIRPSLLMLEWLWNEFYELMQDHPDLWSIRKEKKEEEMTRLERWQETRYIGWFFRWLCRPNVRSRDYLSQRIKRKTDLFGVKNMSTKQRQFVNALLHQVDQSPALRNMLATLIAKREALRQRLKQEHEERMKEDTVEVEIGELEQEAADINPDDPVLEEIVEDEKEDEIQAIRDQILNEALIDFYDWSADLNPADCAALMDLKDKTSYEVLKRPLNLCSRLTETKWDNLAIAEIRCSPKM